MIKIAFVIDTIESPTAGTEKQLLLALDHLDKQQFKPYLCVLQSSKWIKSVFKLCDTYEIGVNSYKTITAYIKLLKFALFLKEKKIDIVQTHFWDSNIAGIFAGKLAGVKAIIATRRNQGYWMNSKEVILQKFMNRWVDITIANCQSTKIWAQKGENIPENKIRVIYNGIDTELYEKVNENIKTKYKMLFKLPLDSYVIGLVANLRPVKGVDIFIKAAKIVKKRINNTIFLIVGDGSKKNELIDLVNGYDLSNSVKFLGRRVDIIPILQMLDIGALSSYSESFSNVIIEYLAAGLPVVSTDVGGCREAIEHGVNGFIVAPGDYKAMAKFIVKIIENNTFESMSYKNVSKVKDRFTAERMIKSYEEIYRALVNL